MSVHRGWEPAGIFRRIFVMVDGMVVARVGCGRTVTVDVTPGEHELVAGMDWVRSEPVRFTSDGGEKAFAVALRAKRPFVRRALDDPTDVSWVEVRELPANPDRLS